MDENSSLGNFGGNKGTAWYKVESDLKDRRSVLTKTELIGTYENGLHILCTFDLPLNDAKVDHFALSLSGEGNALLTDSKPNGIISVPGSNQYILSLPLAENKPPNGEEIVKSRCNELFQDTGDIIVLGVNSVQLKDSINLR